MQRFSISRNGQTYGPYSLDELQRYVASGHVLLTDQAQAEGTSDWVSVSQLLPGTQPGAPPQPDPSSYSGAPAAGYAPPLYPASVLNSPPNLHWALVLLFDVLTCSFFQLVWNLVISSWFRRVAPASRALPLYIGAAVLLVLQFVVGQIVGVSHSMHRFGPYGGYAGRGLFFHGGSVALYGLIALACWIVRLIARFTFRAELERHYNTIEPLSLQINPVLTFFFGGIYLQSVMNEINDRRRLLGQAQGGYARSAYGPR